MVLGEYTEQSNQDCIKLKLSRDDLNKIWKRCGLTADYSANYVSTYFENKKEIENSASTILNELIENAAKYSANRENDIEIDVAVYRNSVVFEVNNYVDSEAFYSFRDFVTKIIESDDIDAAYFEALRSLNGADKEKSGIGLLTIMSFFKLKLGMKFENSENNHDYKVSVQAAMPVGR